MMNWKHLSWALAFSTSMLVARIVVGEFSPTLVDGLTALALSTSVAYLLSLFLSYVPKLISGFLILVVCAFYLGAFRYEAVFGVLPGTEILFYAGEISHLLPSVLGELDAAFVLMLVTLSPALIFWGVYCWRRESASSPSAALIILSLLVFTTMQSFLTPPTSASSEPSVWLLSQLLLKSESASATTELTETDFADFLSFHGAPRAAPSDPRFPLCRDVGADVGRHPRDQSVIILILENVGNDEMRYLPHLTRFANEHIWLRDFMSVGTKSVQAMPAYFGGLPPNPHANYLWQRPLPKMPSLTRHLSDEGYTSAYFHGGDLSFEQQRHYLNQSGFEHIFEFGDYDYPIYGWGYDDASMFFELQHWAEQQKTPYFAAMATISTHHPYILPDDFSPAVQSLDDESRDSLAQVQAYEFLDKTLQNFFDWFETQNALLLIVGDHAPDRGDQKHKFQVPLIVAGLDPSTQAAIKASNSRRGIGYDLPNTVLEALGLSPLACSPGLPLLALEDETGDRHRYTVAGNSLDVVYFHDIENPVAFEKRSLAFYEAAPEGGLGHQIPTEDISGDTLNWFQSIMRVHIDLLEQNAYAPAYVDTKTVLETRPSDHETIFVAHRGNTQGEDRQRENSRAAIQATIESGMTWVEVDIQADQRGEPFLFHDPTVRIDDELYHLNTLSLDQIKALPGMQHVISLEEALETFAEDINFAIEVKPLNHVAMLTRLAQRVRSLINSRPGNNQVIVDSFDLTLLRSIQRDCQCEVGFDHPYRQPVSQDDLTHYAMLGLDWIYLEQSVLDEALLDQAHQAGIKVMGYTINAIDTLSPEIQTRLDGVMTDRSDLKLEWIRE